MARQSLVLVVSREKVYEGYGSTSGEKESFREGPNTSMSFWVARRYLNEDVGFKQEPKLLWNK
jgi:hypothetical protein